MNINHSVEDAGGADYEPSESQGTEAAEVKKKNSFKWIEVSLFIFY